MTWSSGTIETSDNAASIQAVASPMTREERYGFASRYEEEQDTEYAQYIAIQSEDVLQALHNISIIFKALDTALNFIRFVHEPTVDNGKKVIIDSAHLYNMLHGFNWYSNAVNAADIIYLGYLLVKIWRCTSARCCNSCLYWIALFCCIPLLQRRK